MVWYLLNILIFVIAWYWPIQQKWETDSNRVRSKRTCIAGAIGWILLSGLRGLNVGTDTEAYALSFEQAANTNLDTLWQNIINKYIGYGLFFFSKISSSLLYI